MGLSNLFVDRNDMGLHQRQIGLKSVEDVDWTDKRVLDVGCGDGGLSVEVMERTHIAELVGIDPQPDRVAKAIELAKSKELKKSSFYVASADDLKIFPDDSFDAVFCSMAFQQFKNPRKALGEMFRVLKGGGEAIINFNIEKSPVWIQQEILYNKYYGNPNVEITKNKRINEINFLEMTKNAGFSSIAVSVQDDTYFYESFKSIMEGMDVSFFTEKKLNREQLSILNIELKKYLESLWTPDGIPESWKILFGKLTKASLHMHI